MPIIRNLRKDFEEGRMDSLRSLNYAERGTQAPYVVKPEGSTSNQLTKRIDDTSRIAQLLVDKPGLKFLGNQALLQQTDTVDKLSKASSFGREALQSAKNTALQTAKVVGSTLAQVPVNGTGTHFVYGFKTDTYLQPSGGNSRSEFAQFFGAGGIEGAPSALAGKAIEGKVQSKFGDDITPDQFTVTRDSALDYDDKVNNKKPEVNTGTALDQTAVVVDSTLDYDETINKKKPTSNSGTAPDRLPDTVDSALDYDETVNKKKPEDNSKISGGIETTLEPGTLPNSTSNKDIEGDYQGNISTVEGKGVGFIQDFRARESSNDFNGGTSNSYSFNYGNRLINKETRVGLGNQGKVGRNRTSYTINDPDTVDKINKLDVSNKPLNGITENRDLIQLEFQIMTPDDTYYLAFRAFLDTFDDSFNGTWNSSKYLGRADNFYTYSGFERTINIGFKIAAATREEMKPLYRKAATLASVTAPTYGGDGRFMRGSLAKVTVGDYIYEQPGIIESVNYTWQKDYPWEISFQNPEQEDNVQILPHVLDVSISFKVIHDFLPQTGITPLITNYKPISANKQTYIDLPTPAVVKAETEKETEVKRAKENNTPLLPPPFSSELEGNTNTFPFANN